MKTNSELNSTSGIYNFVKYFRLSEVFGTRNDFLRLFILMVLILVIMTVLKPYMFFTSYNFSSMAYQFPEYGIMAFAIMLTMITGGIDLSIVGIANLSGILAAILLNRFNMEGNSSIQTVIVIAAAILIALITGVACGFINGVAIGKFGITPIITTLGTMQLFMGIAIVVTKGAAVNGLPSLFSDMGNGSVWLIPVPFMIFVVIAVLISIMLNNTSFGLRIYKIGSNPVAAKFSGINNCSMIIKTYIISGLLATVSGLVIVARTNSAKADYGTSYTLLSILIAVLGGVNPGGGKGKVSGVVIAVLVLQFLSSGFNMLHFSNFFKDFIWGFVLLLIMVVNFLINNKPFKRKLKGV